MRSKKLLVTLVTLILLLIGCGSSTSSSSDDASPVSKEDQQKETRFSAEEVEISGISDVDYSCIITDHQTGKQFLYTWNSGVDKGGAAMVEIGTVDDTDLTDE